MADAPQTLETPVAGEGRARFSPQRLALILGGVLVVFGLVYFFLLSGGGEEPPPENLPPIVQETPTPEPTETPKEGEGRGRIETFEVFAARDPFKPLVGAGTAAGGGSETPPPDAGPGDGGDGDGTGGTDGSGTGGDGNVGGHRVRVVDVFPNGRRAQIQVDGTVYTVDEGETFAENFELVRASGQCATMLFGDDEFTLCEGEEILK